MVLQLGSMPSVATALKQAGLVPTDFTRHMAFIWAYMFKVRGGGGALGEGGGQAGGVGRGGLAGRGGGR